jgi:hypothetical protein
MRLDWLHKGGMALALLLAAAPGAGAWNAAEIFDHTSYDFGTVAYGAKVEHRFKLENIYVEDVHVAGVRSTCGCTAPHTSKDLLKTWDTAEIVVTIDTLKGLGRKDATIHVDFDLPFKAEVQLQTHCNIRGDVVLRPGVIDFGAIPQGKGGQQRAEVAYAGRGTWQILRVESPNPNLSAKVVQSKREAVGTAWSVEYNLAVTLKDAAPSGYLREDLVLVTNDINPQAARVAVPVEGMIQPAVAVNPSPLLMPGVVPGGNVTRTLIVNGKEAFHILRVDCGDKRFQCLAPADKNIVHRIPVTFTAAPDQKAGHVSTTVRIATDAPGKPTLEVVVGVDVAAAPGAEKPLAKGPGTRD